MVLKVDNWDLPSVRLYEYFGWDTTIEKQVVKTGLEKAFIFARDAAASGIEGVIYDKLFGDDGFCQSSRTNHFQKCEENVIKIEYAIYHLTQEWCTGSVGPSTSPTTTPLPPQPTQLPSATPSQIPIPMPTVTVVTSSSSAAAAGGSGERKLTVLDAINNGLPSPPTPPVFNASGQELICDYIDWGFNEFVFPNHTIAHLIEKARKFCETSSASCEQLETAIRDKVETFIDGICDDVNATSTTKIECKLGKIAAKTATSVFQMTSNFCQSGLCEAVEDLIDIVNGSSIEALKDKECIVLKSHRNKMCTNMNDYINNIIETECTDDVFKSVTVHGTDIVITYQQICDIANTVVYENHFDDDKSVTQWDDIIYEGGHGVFWKKAESFCSSLLGKSQCKKIHTNAVAQLNEICADESNAVECEIVT